MNTRREFLAGGILAGGLVPVAALAAEGTSDSAESIFEKRGGFERLSLTYRHIHLGLAEPFSILHISDTHLCKAGPEDGADFMQFADRRNRIFGGRQEDALRSSLAWAKKNVDYVLHTGDLIDFHTQANLACVRQYYGDAAVRGTTGNHEYQRLPFARGIRNTAEYNAESRAALDAAFGFDTLFTAQVLKGVNFICLDNCYGTFTAEQVRRFEVEVKKGLPLILCMHAPIYSPNLALAADKFWRQRNKRFRTAAVPEPWGDWKRAKDDPVTADFIRRLRSEPLLKGILVGHQHFDLEERFSSTAMQYMVGGNFLYHGSEILFT